MEPAPHIGVFDSGVGGLSVLRELRRELPVATLTYVADSAHAPYGERSDAYVLDRSRALTRHLLANGAGLIVVACNTATAIAINRLREEFGPAPFVGVEPGLKPASASSRTGRIGVMATPGTLASERFRRLVQSQPPGVTVVPQPCPGLAGLIERIDQADSPISEAVRAFCHPLRQAEVDTVVLGCTHYAFVADRIRAAMGDHVGIIDTAQAVARQAARIAGALVATGTARAPGITLLQTTGDLPTFQRIGRALWALPGEHQKVSIE